mmetsp:Transcript_7898/g.23273  ORF Transcript_7898/g.23273 Transcript_7898/m.23273 type:complete len:289 (-) Transcript_7898:3-869(-)
MDRLETTLLIDAAPQHNVSPDRCRGVTVTVTVTITITITITGVCFLGRPKAPQQERHAHARTQGQQNPVGRRALGVQAAPPSQCVERQRERKLDEDARSGGLGLRFGNVPAPSHSVAQPKVSLGDERGVDPAFPLANAAPPHVFLTAPTAGGQGLVVGIEGREQKQQGLNLDVRPPAVGESAVNEERFVVLRGRNQVCEADRCVRFGNPQFLERLGKVPDVCHVCCVALRCVAFFCFVFVFVVFCFCFLFLFGFDDWYRNFLSFLPRSRVLMSVAPVLVSLEFEMYRY